MLNKKRKKKQTNKVPTRIIRQISGCCEQSCAGPVNANPLLPCTYWGATEGFWRNSAIFFFVPFCSVGKKSTGTLIFLWSWISCMVYCIGVRTDGYVNKHIFIIPCTCAVHAAAVSLSSALLLAWWGWVAKKRVQADWEDRQDFRGIRKEGCLRERPWTVEEDLHILTSGISEQPSLVYSI